MLKENCCNQNREGHVSGHRDKMAHIKSTIVYTTRNAQNQKQQIIMV